MNHWPRTHLSESQPSSKRRISDSCFPAFLIETQSRSLNKEGRKSGRCLRGRSTGDVDGSIAGREPLSCAVNCPPASVNCPCNHGDDGQVDHRCRRYAAQETTGTSTHGSRRGLIAVATPRLETVRVAKAQTPERYRSPGPSGRVTIKQSIFEGSGAPFDSPASTQHQSLMISINT